MDEQTAIGRAVLRLTESHGAVPAADMVMADRERFVELERLSNGRAEIPKRRPPAEPTHALDAPPDLTEADPVPAAVVPRRPDRRPPVAWDQNVLMDGGDPFAPPCECGSRTFALPRGRRVCMNPNCDRYEEVRG